MAETLSEQVAALEDALAAAARQASAQRRRGRVAGAREALTRLISHMVSCSVPDVGVAIVQSFRDREYPATGEEPTRGECGVCKDARALQAAFVAGALWADREVTADTLNTPMAESEARRRYPATGEEPTRGELPPHEPDLGRTGNPAQWCERCRVEASRPAPPAVPEPPQQVVPERGEDVARWQLARMAMLEIIDILDNCVGVDGLNATENDTWEEFRASGMLKAFDSLRIVMASEDSRADARRIVSLASRPTASGEG